MVETMASADVGAWTAEKIFKLCTNYGAENFIYNLRQPALNYMTDYESGFSEKFSPYIQRTECGRSSLPELRPGWTTYWTKYKCKNGFFDLVLKIIMLLKDNYHKLTIK